MNCREAQDQIFAERDGAPDITRRTALEGHVAQCADCRRIRDDLTAVFLMWRSDTDKVVVPDATREWHTVRRRIRGGAEAGAERNSLPRRSLLSWITVPLGAAAALAVALLVSSPPSENHAVRPSQVATAELIDVPGNNASTMIFVDDKSGWLIVLASDDKPKSG